MARREQLIALMARRGKTVDEAADAAGSRRPLIPDLQVRQIRNRAELGALWELACRSYPENVSFDVVESWWRAYPIGIQTIFAGEEVVGNFAIRPVPREWQDGFWAGRYSEGDLTAEMVAAAAKAKPHPECWYVGGLLLDASRRGTMAIASLLRQSVLAWFHEARLAHPSTVTAIAMSPHGEQLLHRFGFSLVARASKDGYPIYARTVTLADLAGLLG